MHDGYPGASDEITRIVTGWGGVETGFGERGEWSFKVGRREIGHLHGDRILHIGLPKPVWRELHAAGRLDFHPVFPGREGWGQRRIETEKDVADVVAMLRLNFDRSAAKAHG